MNTAVTYDTQHNNNQHNSEILTLSVQCKSPLSGHPKERYAECHLAECRGANFFGKKFWLQIRMFEFLANFLDTVL